MTNGDFIRSMTDEGEKIDSSADIICPQKKIARGGMNINVNIAISGANIQLFGLIVVKRIFLMDGEDGKQTKKSCLRTLGRITNAN